MHGRVTPIWKYLLKNGVRGVIYHGDVDFMCDFIGGQWAVHSLGLKQITRYSPWFVQGNEAQQLGGFLEEYEGMRYVTIRGAGHMAPQWKPEESKYMFDKFVLENTT